MNVLFHVTAAIGVAAIVIDTKTSYSLFSKKSFKLSVLTFVLGIITHAILDIIPHCYPINSKIDAILSLLVIFGILLLVKNDLD